jgi:protein-S-isoprenylcysteine O-methyltransferase Ste14
MQATRFEFEKRFWIFFGIYAVGFSLANFDHTGFTTAVRHLIAPSILPGSPEAHTVQRLIITGGALLVFLAAALRTWAAAYLRTSIVHDTVQHSETLVADGPFRHVRNPLYFANLPMAAGIGVMATPLGWLFMVAASWLFVYRLIFREEESLRETQGDSYRAYLKAVPRFWPSLKPRVPASNRAPRWGQAFAGESFIWLFGIAELVLAITLNTQAAAAVFVAGFIAHFALARGLTKSSA